MKKQQFTIVVMAQHISLRYEWIFFDNAVGTTSANGSDKIYELKVHSRFKEVGRDVQKGIAGSAAIAVPRRKDY